MYTDPTGYFVSDLWNSAMDRTRTMKDNPSFYSVGNWLTLGTFDTIKGTFSPEKPLSLQHWLDSGTSVLMLAPALNSLSKISVASKEIGVAFKAGQPLGTIQEGVNPKTLIPAKDLSKLDPKRISDAVKYAGDKALEVSRGGVIQQGHHRLAHALKTGRAVDVIITKW
jgi:hypothetical protein